jgi:prevent-host-death family protein
MVLYYLESHDLKQIETDDFTFRRQKNSQDSVIVRDAKLIPSELNRYELKVDGRFYLELVRQLPDEMAKRLGASVKSTEPSNTAIKPQVTGGRTIEGVEVKRLYHLRVNCQPPGGNRLSVPGAIARLMILRSDSRHGHLGRDSLTGCVRKLYSSYQRNGESMGSPLIDKNGAVVVSALNARANFGKLLDRLDQESGSLIIEKRGTPKAVLLSIRDYVRLAAPEPEVLRILGEESVRKGTSAMTVRQIDRVIKTVRTHKKKR